VLYLAVAAFAFGILIRSFYEVPLSITLWVALVGTAVALNGRKMSKTHFAPFVLCSVALWCFALGTARLQLESHNAVNPVLESQIGSAVTLKGVIARDPEIRPTSIHLYVKTEQDLILVTTEIGADWRYGDLVSVQGILKHPEPFETDLGRTFNYPGYLLAQRVSYLISYASVERQLADQGVALIGQLFDFKHKFMRKIELFLPEPSAGLGEGLLLGVKQALGDELEQTFRRTGIIHIVVLSGYNIMIVVYFILYLCRSFLGRRASAFFGILAIAVFAVLVGLGATVVRASIMAALLLIVGLTGRVYLALNGLLLAGVLMLLWNPYLLAFDVGFQLSFLATLGLILLTSHFEERLQWMPSAFKLREFLVATLVTQLFVLPLLLYQIGEFSIVAIVVNMLALPMVAPAMFLTFMTGVTAFISPTFALPIAYVSHLSLAYIIGVAKWFGALPFASFVVPPFPFYLVPFGYLLLGYMLWKLRQPIDPLKGWEIKEV